MKIGFKTRYLGIYWDTLLTLWYTEMAFGVLYLDLGHLFIQIGRVIKDENYYD